MKKMLFAVIVAGAMVACNNEGTSTEEVKDSVMETIDSTADARVDSIQETTDSVKDRLDNSFEKTDSANKAAVDSVNR